MKMLIFDVLQEGVLILDELGRVVFANKASEKLFGRSVKGMETKELEVFFGKGSAWREIVGAQVAISHDFEVEYPSHKYLNVFMSPFDVGDSNQGGNIILIRDDTSKCLHEARKQEEEQLDTLMLLAASVAHEIGNPLNSLGLQLQLLRRKLNGLRAKDSATLAPLADVAIAETRRLDDILKQFLRAMRPTPLARQKVALASIVEESIALIQPEIDARGIEVRSDIPDSIPDLMLDEVQMKQVIYNLLKNAYQSMPVSGGMVLVTAEQSDYDVKLSVADSGCGIEANVLGNIYEPFLTTKSTGTGLGLMIVRRIVAEHGGTMTVATRPQEGTTVTVRLPYRDRRPKLLPGANVEYSNLTDEGTL